MLISALALNQMDNQVVTAVEDLQEVETLREQREQELEQILNELTRRRQEMSSTAISQSMQLEKRCNINHSNRT